MRTIEIKDIEFEFLDHSNRIESEYSKEALEDAFVAWEYMKNCKNPMFSVESILHTHELLMRRLRPDIAGKLRTGDVYIRGKRKGFVSEASLEGELRGLCRNIIFSIDKGFRVSKQFHILFEKIYPFEDGNGRVGRIIYNTHMLRLGFNIHVIHEGAEQMEYYKWFEGGRGRHELNSIYK